jgi:hypothetical protein
MAASEKTCTQLVLLLLLLLLLLQLYTYTRGLLSHAVACIHSPKELIRSALHMRMVAYELPTISNRLLLEPALLSYVCSARPCSALVIRFVITSKYY